MANAYTYIISVGGSKPCKVLFYAGVTSAKFSNIVSLPDSKEDADGRGDIMEAWATPKKVANDKVEGGLYSSDVKSPVVASSSKVSWILDAKARNEKTVNKVVGYAMILPGAGSKQDPIPKTAPVWAGDGTTLDDGRLLYYFQNP